MELEGEGSLEVGSDEDRGGGDGCLRFSDMIECCLLRVDHLMHSVCCMRIVAIGSW